MREAQRFLIFTGDKILQPHPRFIGRIPVCTTRTRHHGKAGEQSQAEAKKIIVLRGRS